MSTTNPQISFADLEFSKQGVCLEPTLNAIADFLDQTLHHRDREG